MSGKEENSPVPPMDKLNWKARSDGVKRGEMGRESYKYTDCGIISLSAEQQRRSDILLQTLNSQVPGRVVGMETVKSGEGKSQRVLREMEESGMKLEDFILVLE